MILRDDLGMSPGKMASQSSHAAVQVALDCMGKDPERFRKYQDGTFGTKVCLSGSGDRLKFLFSLARERNIPCAMIEDSGHAAFFEGQPTLTAVGIGPIQRHEMRELKKLSLVQ